MCGKFILFGHGNFGHAMLELLGKENISFFVHNGEKESLISGEMNFQVLPFEENIKICKDQFIIISVSEKTEGKIVRQLLEHNMDRFLLWEDVIGLWKSDAKCRADKIREYIGIPPWLEPTKQKIKSLVEGHIPLIQDKCSEVEFYMIDSFELSHFLPVYQALLQQGVKAKIVAEPQAINSATAWFDYSETIKLLKEAGVDYCTLLNPDAKVAITTQFPDNLKYYNGYKIQMHYGTTWHRRKSFTYESDVLAGFDCVFVHGQFAESKIHEIDSHIHVTDISYPRYARSFPRQRNGKDLMAKYAFDTEKPILVYCPTWGEYSSIKRFSSAVNILRQKFFVVAKPHHCTLRLESQKEDLRMLYECCDLVLGHDCNLTEIAAMANCAVCDAASGIVTEIPFLNPELPMVLCLYHTREEDFYVDITKFSLCIKSADHLAEAVNQVLKQDPCLHYRQAIMNLLYSPDIYAGIHRAVETICKEI